MNYYYKNEAEQFTFYRLPKILFEDKFKNLPCEAKLIYGLMLDRMGLSIKNNWVDNSNKVYIIFKNEEIATMINCSVKKVINLLDELESFKLIQKKRLGLGKPNLIYVKNFTTNDKENNKENVKDIKNIENSKNIKKADTKETENYCKILKDLKENISYNKLIIAHKENICKIDEILHIMVETLLSKSEYINIAKNKVSIEEVKNIMLKVNYEHIQYILFSLSKTKSKITNMKSYLLTVIYNSVLSIKDYSQTYSQTIDNNFSKKSVKKDNFVNYEQPELDFKKLREYELKSLSESNNEKGDAFMKKLGIPVVAI